MAMTDMDLWQGQSSGALVLYPPEGVGADTLTPLLQTLCTAVNSGFWGRARMTRVGVPGEAWHLETQNLPGWVWLVWSNLLYARQRVAGRHFVLELSGQKQVVNIQPRAYVAPMPSPDMAVDIAQMTEVMSEFFIRFNFAQKISAPDRDAFCEQLDVWAALLDAGAFPIREAPQEMSVIGAYSSRFEDYQTGLVEAEGMVGSHECLGPLISLCNRWNAAQRLVSVELVHTP
jgi:hypothetical protein